MLNDLRKRIGLVWVALRNGTDPSRHLNPIALRGHLISAYLTGVAKAYDQYRRNLSSTEQAYGKREFLRDVHAPPIDLATTVDEILSTLVSRGESVPTKSEVIVLCQPLKQYMFSEQRRLMRLGYEDGCNKLGVVMDKKIVTTVLPGVWNKDDKRWENEQRTDNEFNPDQPRDELGKWTGVSAYGNVVRTQGHENITRKLFSRTVTDRELASLGFSPEGTTVTVSKDSSSLFLNTVSSKTVMSKGIHKPELSCSRRITKGWFAPLTCYNLSIEIPKEGSYGGKGFDLFYDQVHTLKKLGVKRIVASAAGDPNDTDSGAGYYVWPRMGYSGTMSSSQISKLPPGIIEALKGRRDVRDLFDLGKEGKEAWQKHGSSIKVHFDLSDGSRNMRALEAYRNERATRPTSNTELEDNVTISDGV